MQWNDSRVSSARHCQSRVFIRVIFPMNIFPMNVLSNPSLPVIIYSMAIIYIEKGCNFVFFATNKEIGTRQSFLQKKHGTLVQCYPRWAKNLAASRNFCKNFFSANLRWALFWVLPSGCQPAQLERCQGGGHSLVSLDASEISIFFPN